MEAFLMANLKIKRRKDGFDLYVMARRGKNKITVVKRTFVPTFDMAVVTATAAEMLRAYEKPVEDRGI